MCWISNILYKHRDVCYLFRRHVRSVGTFTNYSLKSQLKQKVFSVSRCTDLQCYKVRLPLVSRMASSDNSSGKHINKLASEKSPYLLQHASNPVDWHPWGEEAFEKAKEENKPIFLSIGYSTCHWCHVMEKESFENEDIGKMMNEHFVSIKVDREERPDVDKVYMTFVQATSGHGGWPLSVWLTPDLKPIVGGTYFPPDDRYFGRPGFKTILTTIADKWKSERDNIETQGTRILEALTDAALVQAEGSTSVPDLRQCMQKCYLMLSKTYDEEKGGFGKAPKFPQPVNLNFMFQAYAANPNLTEGKEALKMVLHTLKMMAKGGMHDHVGQGFHRYSTDRDWHVPHFEKMLYDQAQLVVSYLNAYQISKEAEFANVANDILAYVSRDLSNPSGGFYSAEDADSLPVHDATAKKEGAFCVWTDEEIRSLLTDPVESSKAEENVTTADIFCGHYDVRKSGNVDPYKDPHDELKNQNVLIVRGSLEETALHFKMTEEDVEKILEKCRSILFEVRKTRPPPHLDTKMITAWNGLMISGFAQAGQVLSNSEYTQRAELAARFVKAHLYNPGTGKLLRSCYSGEDQQVAQISVPIDAFADDYAFLIRGLIDLYEVSFDQQWLQWAEQLQLKMDELFWDSADGGYFSTDGKDKSVILRMKEEQDGAEPSANSVACNNLLRLASYLDCQAWRERAAGLLTLFGERLLRIPVIAPEMVRALDYYQSTPKQIIIAGDKDSEDTKQLLQCVNSHFLPNKIIILADGNKDGFLYNKLSVLAGMEKVDGKATAYVCKDFTCSLPVTSVEELDKMLKKQPVVDDGSGSCTTM